MTFRIVSATLASGMCLLLGLFVYAKGPSKAINKYFCGFNVGLSLWAIGDLFVVWAYSNDLHDLALWFDRFSYLGAIIVVPFFMLQLGSFTHWTGRRVETFIKSVIFVSFACLLGLIFTPWIIRDVRFNPFAEDTGILFPFLALYFIGGLSFGIFRLIQAYRVSHGTTKSQIKYFCLGVFVGMLGAGDYFIATFWESQPPIYYYLEIAYAGIVAYAILAHRLMDVTVIIRKTIIYSSVMGILTLLYLLVVAVFARLFQGFTGYQTIFSSAVAAGLITLCFQPLRRKVQAYIDSKFFRQYVDREEKLYELSREVITHTTPEAMAQSLIRVLGSTLHPKSAALYLRARDGAGFTLVAQDGNSKLPAQMSETNPLTNYFIDHPQPFVQQDFYDDSGEPVDTRRPSRKEDAA